MTVPLRDVVAALETAYPPATAQSWDRVGLVTGDLDQPVGRVLLALDPTLAVVQEALDRQCDLIVTHHPLLMRGIHSVATTHAKGATVTVGPPEVAVTAAGLVDVTALTSPEGHPLGRVGDLTAPTTLGQFAHDLYAALPHAPVGLRVSGDPVAPVSRIAVLPGAGDDSFDAARARGADVYVTADLPHHPALEAREEARGGIPYLIDAGHWASEAVWLPHLARMLVAALPDQADDATRVEVLISDQCTDPWTFTVGADNNGGMP